MIGTVVDMVDKDTSEVSMPGGRRADRSERFDENFTIRVPRSLRERIDRLAEREDRSAGYIARAALERGLALLEDKSGDGDYGDGKGDAGDR